MKALSLSLSLMALTACAFAESIRIREGDVIPVVFEDALSVRNTRSGGQFSVRVNDDRSLPWGSRLIGRVLRIQKAQRNRPASIDLEFRTLVLPDGSRQSIQAVPASLNRRGNRDGRLSPSSGAKKSDYVVGGLVGGLVLGSLIKKPFEGTFIGGLTGVLLAETQGRENEETFVRRGTEIGAYFERGLSCDYNGRWDRRNENYRNDDRYRGDDLDDRYRDDPRYRDDERYRDDPRYRDDERYRDDRYAENGNACEVTWQQRPIRYERDCEPYRYGDSWMVPAVRTAEQLGLSTDWDDRRKRLYLEDEDNLAFFDLNSRNYRINGKKCTLSRNPVIRNGVLYVSVELFTELRGSAFSVSERRRQ